MGFILDFEYDWVNLKHNVKHSRGSLQLELKLVNDASEHERTESEISDTEQDDSEQVDVVEEKYEEDMISDLINHGN